MLSSSLLPPTVLCIVGADSLDSFPSADDGPFGLLSDQRGPHRPAQLTSGPVSDATPEPTGSASDDVARVVDPSVHAPVADDRRQRTDWQTEEGVYAPEGGGEGGRGGRVPRWERTRRGPAADPVRRHWDGVRPLAGRRASPPGRRPTRSLRSQPCTARPPSGRAIRNSNTADGRRHGDPEGLVVRRTAESPDDRIEHGGRCLQHGRGHRLIEGVHLGAQARALPVPRLLWGGTVIVGRPGIVPSPDANNLIERGSSPSGTRTPASRQEHPCRVRSANLASSSARLRSTRGLACT